MTTPSSTPPPPTPPNGPLTAADLTPDSSRALDRLVESGFAPGVGRDSREGRAVAALLGLLEGPMEGGPALLDARGESLLVDVTMARVLRQQADAGEPGLAGRIGAQKPSPWLSDASARELDAFVSAQWDEHERPAAGAALASLLGAGLPTPTEQERRDLVSRTMALVQGASRERQDAIPFRMKPEPITAGRGGGGFRWSDLISIAAMILVAASVGWPMLFGVKHETMESACASNLGRSAQAFTMYAGDHDGALPQAQASFLGGSWWNVGTREQSHSANLYTLVSRGYATLGDLACPGNKSAAVSRTDHNATDWRSADEVSYSYQLFGPGRPQWNRGAAFVVLSDKSPIIARAKRGEAFDADQSSPNHGGRGQHVLVSDGSVRFLTTSWFGEGPSGAQDNLWLPAETPRSLSGREMPANDRDAFVGP